MRHHRRLGVLPPRRRAVDDDRVGLAHLPARNRPVSFTASRSNTPGRHGTTTNVAARIASVTLADMFGAVSTKAHSMPSRFAARTISPMPRSATLSGKSSDCGSRALRSLCQSVSDPCGSASIKRHARDGLWACAAICAASVLLPEPPLREAKTTTFMRALPVWPSGKIVLVPLIPKLADARRYPMQISESHDSVATFGTPVWNLAWARPPWNRGRNLGRGGEHAQTPGTTLRITGGQAVMTMGKTRRRGATPDCANGL